MKRFLLAIALICVMVFSLTACTLAETGSAGDAPDYSQMDNWVMFPEITKDVDTFYIYSTVYVEASFEEGSTDYATLDNPEMIMGALGEYVTNASVYEESTNLFMPFYRQAGMRYATEISKNSGSLDAVLGGISYEDITAALDYYFKNCNNGRPIHHCRTQPGGSHGQVCAEELLQRASRILQPHGCCLHHWILCDNG